MNYIYNNYSLVTVEAEVTVKAEVTVEAELYIIIH